MSNQPENSQPEDAARMARDLVRAAGRATLSTALAGDEWPFGPLVLTACSHEGAPLLMLSDLAEHARKLKADPRASLLYAAGPGGAAMAEARVSVLGRTAPGERSEEHTTELQSLMRRSYAVFCLKK